MHEMSSFAKHIMETKYSHVKPDGTLEAWDEIARRVAENVMGAVNAPEELIDEIQKIVSEKKFIPAGRYLYASGRPYHQTNNCLCLSVEDSREGWAALLRKSSMALMTGAGIGVNYSKIRPEGAPIKKTGGYATGPVALMQMVNEIGRGVMQGASRRSAVLAIRDSAINNCS
jgi:ribonucleoside-diphosphate reductase alpha chain